MSIHIKLIKRSINASSSDDWVDDAEEDEAKSRGRFSLLLVLLEWPVSNIQSNNCLFMCFTVFQYKRSPLWINVTVFALRHRRRSRFQLLFFPRLSFAAPVGMLENIRTHFFSVPAGCDMKRWCGLSVYIHMKEFWGLWVLDIRNHVWSLLMFWFSVSSSGSEK